MELGGLCRFYRDRVNEMSYEAVEKVSRIPHGTLANLFAEADRLDKPPAQRDAGGEYTPHPYKRLDMEAYYWFYQDLQEVARLRESPDSPLPPNDLAAILAILPADRDLAMQRLSELEELIRRAEGPPPVSPHRLVELLRRMYDAADRARPQYRRQRAPKKRNE